MIYADGVRITQNSSLRMVINTHTIYALENIFFLKSQACCINTYCIKNEKKLCCNGQLVPANNVALSNPFSSLGEGYIIAASLLAAN